MFFPLLGRSTEDRAARNEREPRPVDQVEGGASLCRRAVGALNGERFSRAWDPSIMNVIDAITPPNCVWVGCVHCRSASNRSQERSAVRFFQHPPPGSVRDCIADLPLFGWNGKPGAISQADARSAPI